MGSDVMSRFLPQAFHSRLSRNLTQTLKGQIGHFPQTNENDKSRRWADDTIYVIMGDHGMADTGNHGGSLKHEVSLRIINQIHSYSHPHTVTLGLHAQPHI